MDSTTTDKAKLVISALQLSHDHELDIAKKENVQKILDVLDHEHLGNLDEFMDQLNTSNAFMDHQTKKNEDKILKFFN